MWCAGPPSSRAGAAVVLLVTAIYVNPPRKPACVVSIAFEDIMGILKGGKSERGEINAPPQGGGGGAVWHFFFFFPAIEAVTRHVHTNDLPSKADRGLLKIARPEALCKLLVKIRKALARVGRHHLKVPATCQSRYRIPVQQCMERRANALGVARSEAPGLPSLPAPLNSKAPARDCPLCFCSCLWLPELASLLLSRRYYTERPNEVRLINRMLPVAQASDDGRQMRPPCPSRPTRA
jgi:hypothetical protein